MLSAYWRLRAIWVADQTLTYANAARVTVALIPWKITSGAMAQESEITDNFGFTAGTWATTVQKETAVQTNTVNLFIGATGTLKVVADVNSTDGTMSLYLEQSTDNSIWPSDEADFDIDDLVLICALDMSTDAEDEGRAKNFEI